MPPSKFPISPFQPNLVDESFMRLAIEQALLAGQQGEVPIGAVLVQGGEVLAQAHNAPVSSNNPCAHAEIRAIEQACARMGNYRLGSAATLYVTLQPCLMCLGAILHARIGRVVVGQPQSRFNHGLADSLHAFEQADAWHACRFEEGCLPDECAVPLNAFFQSKRQSRAASLRAVKRVADLPNVDKHTEALLSGLGYRCGADFLSPSIEAHVERLEALALSLKSEVNHKRQAAMLSSLCEYLKGEPVRSWKTFL